MNRILIASFLALTSAGAAFAQGPARHDIVAQCPQISEQLSERLASLQQELGGHALVRVQLVVDAQGLQRVESIDGPRRHASRVRSALHGLACQSPEPQRQVLNIQFGEPEGRPAPHWARAATPTAPR